MKLTEYNAASHALDRATRFDEIKKIRDVAVAAKAYAKQAKDPAMMSRAVRLKFTAETKAGNKLLEMTAKGQLAKPGQGAGKGRAARPLLKLADLDITKDQSSKWQRLEILRRAFPDQWEDKLGKLTRMAVAAAEDIKAVIKEARAERHAMKKQSRLRRMKKLAKKLMAWPTKKYAVIYADPEWKWEAWSEKGLDATSADNHYVTSELDKIKNRPVVTIAADDCVLFLWSTVPMLPQALEVMTAWGFTYRSNFCWDKIKAGTGYWNRNRHETLLIGTRGKIPAPLEGTQFESLLAIAATKHSVKPEKFREIIDAYFPELPKIELNFRGTKAPVGWDVWGDEAPSKAA
jgi:N6-adenosine-specific RNA methylase IME4